MDGQRFDNLTRALARGTSRRHVLHRAGGGLAGGVLAALGIRHASAQLGPVEPMCRQCINMFFSGCVSSCTRSDQFEPETCATACFEGSRTVCTILGECQPEPA